jgi:hypothetical protein
MQTKKLLDKILRDFEKNKRPEDAERIGKKAWGMIQQFHLEQLGKSNAAKAVKDRIIADMTNLALTWDTDDASLSSVQKMFNRLASGRYAEAVALAESSANHKETTAKNTLRQNAKKGTYKKHAKNNEQIEKALKWYKERASDYQGYGGKKRASNDLEARFPPIKSSTYLQHLKKIK